LYTFWGVEQYRDGFRVRPYGEPKSTAEDWLMLSKRKNKSPAAITHKSGSWRVNGDQIHGSVFISRINVTLPDQANRQGIVETKEFLLLQEFLQNVLKYFEQDRQKVFIRLLDYYNKNHPTAIIQKEIQSKLKTDIKRKKEAEKTNRKFEPEVIAVEKASALLDEKDKEIEKLETEMKLLCVLATTGIVTNTYIHEIKYITHQLGTKIKMAKDAIGIDKNSDFAYKYLVQADELRKNFTSWFEVTVGSVRRDKRKMRNTDIYDLVSRILSEWQKILISRRITIKSSIAKISFKCFPNEIESVVSNLLANSVAAFENYNLEEKIIDISIESANKGIIIRYSDNGIGLTGEYKQKPWLILKSFESDKRSTNGDLIGTGMGMWIINRIISEYNGSIDLSENKIQSTGFYVKLQLNIES
jgi:hypothetical protein